MKKPKTYAYDAFGNEKDRVGADPNPFRYCGEYFDVESGSYYLRARYYDPSIGRFTQEDTHWNTSNMIYGDKPQQIGEYEDPLGTSRYVYAPQITAVMQAGNLYGYCSSNPVKWCDPTGNNYCDATKEWMCAGAPTVVISVSLSFSFVEIAKEGLMYVEELGKWVYAKILDGIWYLFFLDGDEKIAYKVSVHEAEHTKNKRKSTKDKHEKGQSRQQKDAGKEKGDARRKGNPNKRHR